MTTYRFRCTVCTVETSQVKPFKTREMTKNGDKGTVQIHCPNCKEWTYGVV